MSRHIDWNELLVGALLVAGSAAVGLPTLTAARLPLPAAVATGAMAGAALFGVLAGPARWVSPPAFRRLVASGWPFVLLIGRAAVEEVAWRGFALAALASALTALPALGVTSVLFSLAHTNVRGRQRLVHCATGGVFGGVYLLTGRLSAAVSAHVVYNGLIAAALLSKYGQRERSDGCRQLEGEARRCAIDA